MGTHLWGLHQMLSLYLTEIMTRQVRKRQVRGRIGDWWDRTRETETGYWTDRQIQYIYEGWEVKQVIYLSTWLVFQHLQKPIHQSHYLSIKLWFHLISSQSGCNLIIRFNLTVRVKVSLHQQEKQREQKNNVPATQPSVWEPLCVHRATAQMSDWTLISSSIIFYYIFI